MPEDEGKQQKLAVATTSEVPSKIPLGPTTTIDLSWLPEAERKELLIGYVKGALDINKKAQDLHVEVGTLKNVLQTMAENTREVSEDGNSVTISHTHTSSIGRTEVIMGNTPEAERGKLTRSQKGLGDWTPYYVIGAIIAVVTIVALLAK